MENFLTGFAMGFCIAAPVGPIGLLCIRRSIADGRLAGLVCGLGAATADAVYSLVAAIGLTAVTHFLLDHRAPIQFCGGLFLVYLGVSLVRAKPASIVASPVDAPNLAGTYFSTFALTLANPATVLSFVGIFAGLGVGASTTGVLPAGLLVAGVFAGSATWWLVLSTGSSWLGAQVRAERLHLVNLLSGGLIGLFGAWRLVALFR